MALLRRGIDAPLEEGALSLLTPFAAFLLAQALDCSGVVAVMVSALMLAYFGPVVIRARSRLLANGFWDIATFMINGSLWVFVGVQIPGALHGIYQLDGGLRHAVYLAAGRHRRHRRDPVCLGGIQHCVGSCRGR